MWFEVICGLVLIYCLWKCFAKPADYPPGYWGLPLIGYIPFNKKTVAENCLELREKHGNSPIISIFIKMREILPLNKCPQVMTIFSSNFGVVLGNGMTWLNTRRFTLHHLRDLGMGKSSLVPVIQNEAIELVKALKLEAGKPALISNSVAVATLNIIWQMVASKTYKREDEDFKRFLRVMAKFRKEMVNIVIADCFPWFFKITPTFISKRIIDTKVLDELSSNLRNLIMGDIVDHEEKLDMNDPKDFIDNYLIEMKKQENDPNSTFSNRFEMFDSSNYTIEQRILTSTRVHERLRNDKIIENIRADFQNRLNRAAPPKRSCTTESVLEVCTNIFNGSATTWSLMNPGEDLTSSISDLFGAGQETVSNTLHWAFFYLAKYPEIQKRLQKEVDKVLPKGTLVSVDDKPRLFYMEAFIQETLRNSNFPFGIMRTPSQDIHFGGYKIPKDAVVCPMVLWINYDPKYWESPYEFRPERFLDIDGKFVQPRERLYVFGMGKRQCLGEALARMELLIFLSTVVQNINFAVPPGKALDMRPLPVTLSTLPDLNQELLMTIR